MATNTLYLNENVDIHFENDYYSIRAKDNIPNGTLILVEHVVFGDFQYLMSSLFYNEELCNSLYPRKYGSSMDEIIKIIRTKINSNVFGFENNILVIGDTFSKFNHSCHPNCRMDIVDKVSDERFYGIWTHKKIEKGSELFIDYVNGGSIEYHQSMMDLLGAKCSCTSKYILTNTQRSKIMMDLASVYRENKKDYIETLTDTYISSKKGRDAMKQKQHAKKNAFRFIIRKE